MPINRYLLNPDSGAIAGLWSTKGALSKHQHLDVEDPAFGVHVWYYVREGSAGEQLKATLRVTNAGSGGRRKEAEKQVEGVHESVADHRTLCGGVRISLESGRARNGG